MNKKILIIIGLIIILAFIDYKIPLQSVAPECFEDADCKSLVQIGYCDVESTCVQGRCQTKQIRCEEICYGGNDEDMDGKIDCKDPDCFDSGWCQCTQSSFTYCKVGACFCASGQPVWLVDEGEGYCICK